MWGRKGVPVPGYLGNPPYEGRRCTPFNNDPARLLPSRLKDAPEIASDVGRKRPASVTQATRDVQAQHIEKGKRAESDAGIPTLSRRLEIGGAVYPHRCREGSEGDRPWRAAESAQRNPEKRREEAVLDPLAHAAPSDEFVKVVARAAGWTTEVDEVLRWQRVATENSCGDCVKEKPVRAERLLEIEHERRPEEIAGL